MCNWYIFYNATINRYNSEIIINKFYGKFIPSFDYYCKNKQIREFKYAISINGWYATDVIYAIPETSDKKIFVYESGNVSEMVNSHVHKIFEEIDTLPPIEKKSKPIIYNHNMDVGTVMGLINPRDNKYNGVDNIPALIRDDAEDAKDDAENDDAENDDAENDAENDDDNHAAVYEYIPVNNDDEIQMLQSILLAALNIGQ